MFVYNRLIDDNWWLISRILLILWYNYRMLWYERWLLRPIRINDIIVLCIRSLSSILPAHSCIMSLRDDNQSNQYQSGYRKHHPFSNDKPSTVWELVKTSILITTFVKTSAAIRPVAVINCATIGVTIFKTETVSLTKRFIDAWIRLAGVNSTDY